MLENVALLKRDPVTVPAILGLDKVPEDPGAQRRFFFKSPLIAQRLAILKNTVGGRSLVIVVVGERGSGKTTLMHQFMATAGRRNKTGRIRLKTRDTADRTAWRNLNERMLFISPKKHRPTVIIDDAHKLSALEIKTLMQSAFTSTGERRLQNIVLFAEPDIRERFAEIAHWLPERSVIDKIFMTPLTERQTEEYLRHRLKMAGWLRKNPFSDDQVREIHQLSGGLPGWINGEAFMLLKKMDLREERLKPSLMAPLLQIFYRQFRWMEKIPCFSRN